MGNFNQLIIYYLEYVLIVIVEKINGKLEPEYVGCYIDEKNERDLNGKTYLNSPEMTIKKCARHCKGFKYMGVQVSNMVLSSKSKSHAHDLIILTINIFDKLNCDIPNFIERNFTYRSTSNESNTIEYVKL